MRISPSILKNTGLAAAVVAAILAFVGLEHNATETSRVNPESAIAMAIVAYVFVRASEST